MILSSIVIHLKNIYNIWKRYFKRLKQCNIVIKPSKCKLVREEIVYLGHVVGNGVLKPDPNNLKAILGYIFTHKHFKK